MFTDSELAGKPAPRNDDIPAFFRTLLDEILHAVSAPAELLGKPYLLPKYDDPEFVVRGIWYLYAGGSTATRPTLNPRPQLNWQPSWFRWFRIFLNLSAKTFFSRKRLPLSILD